ncbi:DUF3632 domain-containing protein [Acaryochloris marina]|uniref:Uncharacterized protein n=1 Tax=Acaryochloris marina (strain MBIC 11017) TaxID=329726 RepID=B0C739_ACAM1|nr:DUF3632 domain-containing protein [Acaryochloris marina]ABW28878.1 hypothetical protein AM1_3893 [Acaryochloris marina MBIC11017]BDM77857.1 hypothetical protein AM10699_07270 [Acaryochloris marina MBIC10699]
MNDLETLQGLEKLELLIHTGIERGEHLVQQACRVDEVKQLLQAMQQQQASLTAATEQAELLSAQVLDLETTMALLHNNRQTLEQQYHTLARQVETCSQSIQAVSTQIAGIDQATQQHESIMQVLTQLKQQVQQDKQARSDQDQNIQQLQIDMAHLRQTSDTQNSHWQQQQSEQIQLVHTLEAQLTRQGDQLARLVTQIEAFKYEAVEYRLESLETLSPNIAQLKSQIQAVEHRLRQDMEASQKRLAQRYRILVVVSVIAIAGLVLWGQWYFRRTDKRSSSPSQSLISKRPVACHAHPGDIV